VKLPKHITDALGRPICVCPVCNSRVEITASDTIAQHWRRNGYSTRRFRCDGSAQPAPEGAVLAWLQEELARKRGLAVECRTRAEVEMRTAEKCDAEAAQIEHVIARVENK